MDQNPLFSLTGQNCSPALVHRVVLEKVVASWSRWQRQRHWDPALPRAPPPGSALWMPQLHLHPGHGSYFCLALESILKSHQYACWQERAVSAEKRDGSVLVFHSTTWLMLFWLFGGVLQNFFTLSEDKEEQRQGMIQRLRRRQPLEVRAFWEDRQINMTFSRGI